MRWRDLGLTYEQAISGIESATRFVMANEGVPDEGQDAILMMLRHMRVALDTRASDVRALVDLLIEKGVFTVEEIEEQLRRSANEELAIVEVEMTEKYDREFKFR